jgi:hypothetical protein
MTTPTGAAGAALTAAYEELRAWAGGQPRSGPRPPGLALLLRGGVPAWLAAATARPLAAVLSAPAGAGHAAPPAAVAELALVLATMVAACHREVQR